MGIINKEKNNTLLAYLFGLLIFLLTVSAVSFLLSALAVFLGLNGSYSVLFASVSLAIGCFISAYFIVKIIGGRGLFNGALFSISAFILIKIISLIIFGGTVSLTSLFHLIISLLSGMLGGIISANRTTKRKVI